MNTKIIRLLKRVFDILEEIESQIYKCDCDPYPSESCQPDCRGRKRLVSDTDIELFEQLVAESRI